MSDVVAAIQADPALTGRVIKLASSAQYGSAVTISSAKEASLRLGLKTVCNVALGFTLVAGNRSGRCTAFDYDRYWSWSLANAASAGILAAELKLGDSAEAFTCALLVRVGELALASVHPSDYAEVLVRARRPGGHSLRELEQSRFQIDHAEATAAMMNDWGLPAQFASASMGYLDEGAREEIETPPARSLLSVLLLSSAFAEYCLASDDQRRVVLKSAEEACREHGIAGESFESLTARIVADWNEWGEILKVPTYEVPAAAELRARRSRTEVAPGVVEEVRANGLRILAVDDDAVSLRLLERHLEAAGHTVVTATNGRQAMAAALESNPQVVITDWKMPEMDGLQFCKALRRFTSGRSMYVLLLADRGEEDRIVEAFDGDVDDYIVKPFKTKTLLARIRAGIRVVGLQHQAELDKKLQREQLERLSVLTRKLRAAALTDPLTELPNRRYAMQRLESEWLAWRRSGQPLSLLMVDIDHFKAVNDLYGHDAGDDVLKATGTAISSSLDHGDVCARWGGEEFLVLSPGASRESAISLAARIRIAVEGQTESFGPCKHIVTVSVGIATTNDVYALGSASEILKLADIACYQAKRNGRNCWVMAEAAWLQDPPKVRRSGLERRGQINRRNNTV